MCPMTSTGLAENAARIRQLATELQDEKVAAATEVTAMLAEPVRAYPPVPPYVGMKNYGYMKSRSRRTGYYGAQITTPTPQIAGGKVVGYIKSAAPYSNWIRGVPDGSYQGAWMHRPFWKSLSDIINEYRDKAYQLVNDRITALVRRVMGS